MLRSNSQHTPLVFNRVNNVAGSTHFPSFGNQNLITLSQWQYWWWFWFTSMLCIYFVFIVRILFSHHYNFNPRMTTTYRSRGRWGDLLICAIPIFWCLNILSSSHFLLRHLEWQTENSLFTLRVRGKQWYWVYKYDLRAHHDINTSHIIIGRRKKVKLLKTNFNAFEEYTSYPLIPRFTADRLNDPFEKLNKIENRLTAPNQLGWAIAKNSLRGKSLLGMGALLDSLRLHSSKEFSQKMPNYPRYSEAGFILALEDWEKYFDNKNHIMLRFSYWKELADGERDLDNLPETSSKWFKKKWFQEALVRVREQRRKTRYYQSMADAPNNAGTLIHNEMRHTNETSMLGIDHRSLSRRLEQPYHLSRAVIGVISQVYPFPEELNQHVFPTLYRSTQISTAQNYPKYLISRVAAQARWDAIQADHDTVVNLLFSPNTYQSVTDKMIYKAGSKDGPNPIIVRWFVLGRVMRDMRVPRRHRLEVNPMLIKTIIFALMSRHLEDCAEVHSKNKQALFGRLTTAVNTFSTSQAVTEVVDKKFATIWARAEYTSRELVKKKQRQDRALRWSISKDLQCLKGVESTTFAHLIGIWKRANEEVFEATFERHFNNLKRQLTIERAVWKTLEKALRLPRSLSAPVPLGAFKAEIDDHQTVQLAERGVEASILSAKWVRDLDFRTIKHPGETVEPAFYTGTWFTQIALRRRLNNTNYFVNRAVIDLGASEHKLVGVVSKCRTGCAAELVDQVKIALQTVPGKWLMRLSAGYVKDSIPLAKQVEGVESIKRQIILREFHRCGERGLTGLQLGLLRHMLFKIETPLYPMLWSVGLVKKCHSLAVASVLNPDTSASLNTPADINWHGRKPNTCPAERVLTDAINDIRLVQRAEATHRAERQATLFIYKKIKNSVWLSTGLAKHHRSFMSKFLKHTRKPTPAANNKPSTALSTSAPAAAKNTTSLEPEDRGLDAGRLRYLHMSQHYLKARKWSMAVNACARDLVFSTHPTYRKIYAHVRNRVFLAHPAYREARVRLLDRVLPNHPVYKGVRARMLHQILSADPAYLKERRIQSEMVDACARDLVFSAYPTYCKASAYIRDRVFSAHPAYREARARLLDQILPDHPVYKGVRARILTYPTSTDPVDKGRVVDAEWRRKFMYKLMEPLPKQMGATLSHTHNQSAPLDLPHTNPTPNPQKLFGRRNDEPFDIKNWVAVQEKNAAMEEQIKNASSRVLYKAASTYLRDRACRHLNQAPQALIKMAVDDHKLHLAMRTDLFQNKGGERPIRAVDAIQKFLESNLNTAIMGGFSPYKTKEELTRSFAQMHYDLVRDAKIEQTVVKYLFQAQVRARAHALYRNKKFETRVTIRRVTRLHNMRRLLSQAAGLKDDARGVGFTPVMYFFKRSITKRVELHQLHLQVYRYIMRKCGTDLINAMAERQTDEFCKSMRESFQKDFLARAEHSDVSKFLNSWKSYPHSAECNARFKRFRAFHYMLSRFHASTHTRCLNENIQGLTESLILSRSVIPMAAELVRHDVYSQSPLWSFGTDHARDVQAAVNTAFADYVKDSVAQHKHSVIADRLKTHAAYLYYLSPRQAYLTTLLQKYFVKGCIDQCRYHHLAKVSRRCEGYLCLYKLPPSPESLYFIDGGNHVKMANAQKTFCNANNRNVLGVSNWARRFTHPENSGFVNSPRELSTHRWVKNNLQHRNRFRFYVVNRQNGAWKNRFFKFQTQEATDGIRDLNPNVHMTIIQKKNEPTIFTTKLKPYFSNPASTIMVEKNGTVELSLKPSVYTYAEIRDFNMNKRTLSKKQSYRREIMGSKRLLWVTRQIVLPVRTPITIITNSYDVIHSWFIPGLGLKMDCVPGRSTHHTIYIDRPGYYYGQCAEVCGRRHHHMPIKILAVPFTHFLFWWNKKVNSRHWAKEEDLEN